MRCLILKTRFSSFLAGVLSVTLVFSLVTSALAFAGQVSFGGVNIAVFGQKQVDAAESFATVGGAQVPSSLTYTDEAGGGTVYLPMRLMAELLDTDIAWRADSKTVDFGGREPSEGDVEISLGGVVVVPGGEADPITKIVDAPAFGIQNGPFTEVEPSAEHKEGKSHATFLDNADFSSTTGFLNQDYFGDAQFDYIEITITNHGAPVGFMVSQANVLSGAINEFFSNVRLETGESMTRAFTISGDHSDLSRWLRLSVDTIGSPGKVTDITANVAMYYKGT